MSEPPDAFMPRLHALVSDSARRVGLTAHQAAALAALVCTRTTNAFGGSSVYIPARPRIDPAELRAEFTGRNYAELARRHGCTTRHIRNLLRTSR